MNQTYTVSCPGAPGPSWEVIGIEVKFSPAPSPHCVSQFPYKRDMGKVLGTYKRAKITSRTIGLLAAGAERERVSNSTTRGLSSQKEREQKKFDTGFETLTVLESSTK